MVVALMHLGARRCSTRDVGVHLERGMRGRERAAVVTRGVWWVSPGGIFSGLGLPLACGILDWDSDSAALFSSRSGSSDWAQVCPASSTTPQRNTGLGYLRDPTGTGL